MRAVPMILAVALALIACGPATPEPENPCDGAANTADPSPEPKDGLEVDPQEQECFAKIDAVTAAYEAEDLGNAESLADDAIGVCGDGHNLFHIKALIVARGGNFEEAASLLRKEISAPPSSDDAIALLASIWTQLTPDTQASFLAMGQTREDAIALPSMRAQFTWAQELACFGEEPLSWGSAPDVHEGKKLELLEFDCPDGKTHAFYLVPPPDPIEEMLKRKVDPAN